MTTKHIKILPPSALRRKLNISVLHFNDTSEVKSLPEFVGHERALEALNFGIEVKSKGYNLYAMGPSGIGKFSLIMNLLQDKATEQPVPSDWCYVHHFEIPDKPIAIKLPPGRGFQFQHDMKSFVHELGSNILTIFESEEHHAKTRKIIRYYEKKRKSIIKSTFMQEDETAPLLYKKVHRKEQQLKRHAVSGILKPMISKLKRRYKKFKLIIKYLSEVQDDILYHIDDFLLQDEKTNLISFSADNPALVKYKINLLVDNRKRKGAPVIFDESPNYSSLICRIEHTTVLGNVTTNFSLIKAGSLHAANGGYLVLEARKLKKNTEAWEALKSALFARKIMIKPMEHAPEYFKPISLEPTPIPLNVKIILIGDRNTYYNWCLRDSDFIELFKVPVDFDEELPRNPKNIRLYVKLIAALARQNHLLPLHNKAVAEVIDHSSRLIDDTEKLSIDITSIKDLLIESEYWAKKNRKKIVRAVDVKHAIQAKIHRMDRSRALYYEDIKRDFILIHTTGKSIGQVNGLSVRRVGDYSFGHPTRITARVRIGKGKIIDIQREIKLAGPLHSKASLIITQFLGSKFNLDQPFSLSASLAFEQIYCWTDGDSASVGELCALLSALAEVPIYQYLAVTGSIDQYGQVQAIGGVNEKIEGFFDICKAKGLNGKQGVLIPAVNEKNLMLREDVVAAAKARKFFIYPVDTIEDAILLLTGCTAGERNGHGLFPENSLYRKIESRLKLFTKNRDSIT